MKKRLFGTDGIRGIAVTELTCELIMQIGRALTYMTREVAGKRPVILVGKDTRISSDVLEAALCAGICSAGGNAQCLGVVPTPAVAYLVRQTRADAGVMISASHNSTEFNGLKIFDYTGFKMSDEAEEEIEQLILDYPDRIEIDGDVGRIEQYKNAAEQYISHLAHLSSARLDGMRVVIDCANGSASATAEELFTRLGADVQVIHAKPDGQNINMGCGSAHIDNLMEYVEQEGCDVGLAFDGDADRCLAVDETGELVDGDKMIAIIAKACKEQKKLKHDAVVVTTMSNLGFTSFANEEGIRRVTANVGSRYVLEKMLDGGYNLGGEQNGHIIFLDDATTGDGQLAGIRLLEIMKQTGKKLSELAGVMKRFPQVMINVRIPHYQRENWKNDEQITALIDAREAELGEAGRILVRESGTEPLIRVMIEGKDFNRINAIAMEISEKIRERVYR